MINADVIIILVYLRHHDFERNHGLSANQGVTICGHITVIQITSAKFFPLISLCYHADTLYRDYSVIGQKFSDHD